MFASTLLALSLRLANPHEVPVDALLRCGDATRSVTVDARGVVDVPRSAGCTSADAALPLTVLELADDGDERQRLVTSEAACDVPTMWVPSFACRNGMATAYVQPVDGATYEWSVEGATIVSGAGSHRITVQLTDPSLATLRVQRSTGACAGSASGVIHVREPIVVKEFVVPGDVTADQPVTLRWSYEPGREPNAQLLAGDAFAQPIALGASQRSYTFTPKTSGARTIELRASYAHTIATAPPKRRRAASGAMTAASECPAARASAKMNVTGCTEDGIAITVPEDILAGATFFATLSTGGQVEWSVENGTIKSTSPLKEMIEVVAGAGGKVRITARLEAKPGCFAAAEAEVPIILSAEQCAVPPSATLAVGARDCDRARVVATFTGAPPFSGRWSDGREFRTSANVLTNDYIDSGTYNITEFRDSACFGSVTPVTVETLRPTVRIEEVSNSCGVVRLAATFRGTPPFTAVWSDWEPIHTMEHRIERTARMPGGYNDPDEWQIHNFRDANCDFAPASNILRPAPVPVAGIFGAGPYCQTSSTSGPSVYVSGYRGSGLGFHGPIVAEWMDGAITSSTTNVAIRALPPITTPTGTFELKRVLFAGCEADLESTTVEVINRPTPQVAAIADTSVCMGEQVTARIASPPVPEAVLRWNARGQYALNSSALDGTEFTFTSRLPGSVWVSVAADHLDGKCNSKSAETQVVFGEIMDLVNARLDPDVIKAGGSTRIVWDDSGSSIVPRIVLPPDRASGLVAQPGATGGATFIDKAGPGTVPITLQWSDCRGTQSKTLTLTIVP